jgi:hypothetical protein
MDKASFTKYLNAIKKFNVEADSFNDHLKAISQGGFSEVGFDLLDSYVALLSEAVGDDGDWIAWYCFDNDFGARKLRAGYDGNEKPIRNVNDLWNLIQEGKKQ